jgi:hypothetical protein
LASTVTPTASLALVSVVLLLLEIRISRGALYVGQLVGLVFTFSTGRLFPCEDDRPPKTFHTELAYVIRLTHLLGYVIVRRG